MNNESGNSPPVGLKEYLDGIGAVVKKVPAAWVKCELHTLKLMDRCTRMEFIEHEAGKQVAQVRGICWSGVWQRVCANFKAAGLPLEAGSQVLVKLEASLQAGYGFQVTVLDIDVTFALGDLNARLQAIRSHLKEIGVWESNRSLPLPDDFLKVAVISPAGAAGLGDFRSTIDRLARAGLVQVDYFEAPFQTREAPERITELLRRLYRDCRSAETRYNAVAIIRGGGASADLAWLVDQKLAEAVCRMNVPVMTGIGHERDQTILDEVACIRCDTPSKVAEYISSIILNGAIAGHHAFELIQKQAGQSLDKSQVGLTSYAFSVHRDAVETVRLVESHVRTTAAAPEPDARRILDQTQEAVSTVAEKALSGGRASREAARDALLTLRRQIETNVQGGLRQLELGSERSLSEINVRVDAVPGAATFEVGRVQQQIQADASSVSAAASTLVSKARDQLLADAKGVLNECAAVASAAQVLADAVHPRTVLAAGYSILRTTSGAPLTNIEVLSSEDRVVAEMRDGRAELMTTKKSAKEVNE